ncbi:MAG: DUF6465 family protein [Lachnospiraceae bacterium]|nr:DUF6465 family protein [Lachnospiraceae bacterium]
MKTNVYLEYDGRQYDFAKIVDKAKKAVKKNGNADTKDIKIYIKPEDGKAYYTAAADKVCGDVEL